MGITKGQAIIWELRRRIDAGEWPCAYRLPTERQLAREFSVSRATIQHVIQHLSDNGLLERLPNCRPTVAAPSKLPVAMKAFRDQIAVWLPPNLEEIGEASILQGIRRAIGELGYSAVIGCPPVAEPVSAPSSESRFLQSALQNPQIAGAIVWDSGSDLVIPSYQSFMAAKIPLVFIDREPPESIVADAVMTNNRKGAKLAIQHLIALGHKNIGVVLSCETVSSVQERLEGYRQALDSAEISYRPELIIAANAGYARANPDQVLNALDRLLALPNPPTALFAVNDYLAFNLTDALKKRGISVPNHISVVGFDWLLRWLPTGGHLTSVGQNFETIGKLAAERVLEQIKTGSNHVTSHIYVDAPLVVKETTARPPDPSEHRLSYPNSIGVIS